MGGGRREGEGIEVELVLVTGNGSFVKSIETVFVPRGTFLSDGTTKGCLIVDILGGAGEDREETGGGDLTKGFSNLIRLAGY